MNKFNEQKNILQLKEYLLYNTLLILRNKKNKKNFIIIFNDFCIYLIKLLKKII